MNNIYELIRKKRIYFDGGMGTMLQKRGLGSGELPELWCIEHPEIIEDIHCRYIEAGANIITTNTFGVNCLKHSNYEELIRSAILCAKRAAAGNNNTFVAFDIGPLGRFIEPMGDISFEEAVEVFAKNVRVASECGVDLIIIETMTDSHETKAAVLAVKEICDLPIFVTNVYDENGKMLTGASPEAMVAMLEGMGVSALGINCSLGPDKMVGLIERISKCSSLPVIANPNAGLPSVKDGKTSYSMDAEQFSEYAVQLARAGASIIGGCCGTEPEYIRKTVEKTKNILLNPIENKKRTIVSSYSTAIEIGDTPILIGERINPTGKPRFKDALVNKDIDYIVKVGLDQADSGAHILDVNVGLPNIDEDEILYEVVSSLQGVCDLPLQLDSSSSTALERSMRIYNGKPLINSVNGDTDSMNKIFPLIKKYGGVVVALTLDKDGIPDTAEKRLEIAKRIVTCAKAYGIDCKDIIFDPLAMSISYDSRNAGVTLDALEMLSKMGYNTVLGISNISFGLPGRAMINSSFLTMALQRGLSCAIVNPLSKELMDAYHSYLALSGADVSCQEFIKYSLKSSCSTAMDLKVEDYSLSETIKRGLVNISEENTVKSLKKYSPLEVINNEIIPALNDVGRLFEQGKIFLPQLLNSAQAASLAFSVVKEKMPKKEFNGNTIVLATVEGDVHDIGKNIVKLLLESYGFTVFDLGKNVSSEKILCAVKNHKCKLVALSALMTTTIDAMKETVVALKSYDPEIKIMVGGAVLNEDIAAQMGADLYGPDAMSAVRYAQEFYG